MLLLWGGYFVGIVPKVETLTTMLWLTITIACVAARHMRFTNPMRKKRKTTGSIGRRTAQQNENMGKIKGLRTKTNEQLKIDDVAVLSMNDKLHTLERLLATPLNKIEEIAQDGTLPYFYRGCAMMLVGNNLVDYFSLLRLCREIIKMDKEQKRETDFF